MSTDSLCPNCQTLLGDNPSKCDHCRAFQAGLAAGRSRPGLNPRVLVALVLGLLAMAATAPFDLFETTGSKATVRTVPVAVSARPGAPSPPIRPARPGVRFRLTEGPDGASLAVRGKWSVQAGSGTLQGEVDVKVGESGRPVGTPAAAPARHLNPGDSDPDRPVISGRLSWNGITLNLTGGGPERGDRVSVSIDPAPPSPGPVR